MNLRYSSVTVLAPLLRHALIDQEITPALVSLESQSGIIPVLDRVQKEE
ncbi:MAG: hypothetical protein ACSHX2_05075 [Rubritalea sp.]